MGRIRPIEDVPRFLRGAQKSVAGAHRQVGAGIEKLVLKELSGAVKRNHPKGRGVLAASFKVKLLRGRKRLTASISSNVPYARQRDKGGVIKPRRGLFLAIPLSQHAKETRLWPRQWAPGVLFLFKSKRGKLLLAEKKSTQKRTARGRFASGFNRSLVVHYVLKKSVTQDGSGYVKEARGRIAPAVRGLTGKVLTQRLKKDFIASAPPRFGHGWFH